MRLRTATGLTLASCTILFAACSSSDGTTAGFAVADGGTSTSSSSGSPGSSTSSSGSPGSSSGGNDSGIEDGGADAEVDSGLVTVGDGSVGAGCNTDAECTSGVCSAGHACVTSVSCRASNGAVPGVDTCGSATSNDSCCGTLTLPLTTTRTLDKYEITAGRIRAFIADVTKQNNGVPNVQKFAKDFAAAHPGSQLDNVVQNYPAVAPYSAYIDLLPSDGALTSTSPLPVWLGAFPQDAMNIEDGCYLEPNAYGAATYWQDPTTLEHYNIGYTVDPNDNHTPKYFNGVRKFTQAQLDGKPQNCTPPILLAAFCAWDGGELALATDYHEVYGSNKFVLEKADNTAGDTVYLPWTAVLPWSDFNWRNGHNGPCPVGWPGCVSGTIPVFFSSPPNASPFDDDSPEIAEPGRFQKDVTKAVSPDGGGWYDIGGNLLEAAWPNTPLFTGVQDFCDTTIAGTTAATQCSRTFTDATTGAVTTRPGTLRYKGKDPAIALIGYSFEIHDEYGQTYFADANSTNTLQTDIGGYSFPAHFQYGKVGGRCARVKK